MIIFPVFGLVVAILLFLLARHFKRTGDQAERVVRKWIDDFEADTTKWKSK